ncbi:hypothetical protein L6164_007824 [Bauhinia variegata]|uniref:Uncharacterized protein n=1 Tax=Bauhinia variegata TaxID=167791 RepID=A0ACB9PHQ5_BAUVA|nr:hypothetical protein L6164_007824 [Bauhinia variegata]
MEAGGSLSNGSERGNGNRKRKNEAETSPNITEQTIAKILHKRKMRFNSETARFFFDNTAPGYGWLLPGWVVEERHMIHGRIYKYYYDPDGNFYKTLTEVLNAWERDGLVLIDF